jgi:hypothetical protein
VAIAQKWCGKTRCYFDFRGKHIDESLIATQQLGVIDVLLQRFIATCDLEELVTHRIDLSPHELRGSQLTPDSIQIDDNIPRSASD